MATDNLNLDTLTASQNDKTTTVNNAIERLDDLLGDVVDIDLTASSPISLSTSESERARVLRMTGTLTEDMTVQFQSNTRRTPVILWRDGSNSTFTLTIQNPTVQAGHLVGEVRLRENDIVEVMKTSNDSTEEGVFPTGEPMVYIVGHAYGSAAASFQDPGDTFESSQEVWRQVFSRARTIFKPAFQGSEGHLGAAATAQTDFDILIDGGSVGTMRFAISGTVATFILAADLDVLEGEVMTIVAPGSADATAADLSFELRGYRH